ncbi:hypothetical protein LJB42_000752 [Komagataella kurtzmanii]|nr:hypothetical protein LJB42_000752 [Komagataella kurtzmanii]
MTTKDLLYKKFVLFGDSITQRTFDQYILGGDPSRLDYSLGAQLTSIYNRKLQVLNRGFSGYNTEHARHILPELLRLEHDESNSKVELMWIFFGSNDAVEKGLQKVELERYEQNLNFLTQLALDRGIKIILITPGVVDDCVLSQRDPEWKDGHFRTTTRNKMYAAAVKRVGKHFNVPVLDLLTALETHGNFEQLLVDGLHFLGKAYQILFRELLNLIETEYPELHPDKLPMKLPYWRDIDPSDIEGSLNG